MTVEAHDRDLQLSRVFSLAMQSLMRRPTTALLLAVATIYGPNLVVAYFWPAPPGSAFSWPFIAWSFATLPFYSPAAIFAAWLAFQLVKVEDHPPPRPLRTVLARVVPLCVTGWIVGIGAFVGALALLIPGIVWSVACQVVLPAAALERLGPFEAIGRSFRLTEHRRWAIFGFSLVAILPVSLTGQLVALALSDWRLDGAEGALVSLGVRPVSTTLVAVLDAALAAAFYQELLRLPRLGAAQAAA